MDREATAILSEELNRQLREERPTVRLLHVLDEARDSRPHMREDLDTARLPRPAQPSFAQIDRWIDAHAEQLPRTLAELSTYPMAFRRVIVNRVAPAVRASLWQEHLRTFLGPDSTLGPAQRAFVEETIDRCPDIFGGTHADTQTQVLTLEPQIAALFTREQAIAMFGTIGPPEPVGGLPLPPGA